MTSNPHDISELFRAEYSKMIAVLCKTFGLSQMEIAEDIVGDTFLLATETWSFKGLPDQPKSWLYKVAKNKTLDYLRRQQTFQQKIAVEVQRNSKATEPALDLSLANIQDSQLKMLFALCHPALNQEAQITLALRLLGGFGVEQIAAAFLTNKAVINKRLYRAKEKLRKHQISLELPPENSLPQRLDNVLATLYLLFNEGYYSSSKHEQLNKDFCLEAMRLAFLLTRQQNTHSPEVDALIALMCFHASRFAARNQDGQLFLYPHQDTQLWDQALIQKGEDYMNSAARGSEIGKYHLEAAIAYWHTQPEHPAKWQQILQLYNYLLQIAYSPLIALNRTYALSKAKSVEIALAEAKKIKLDNSHWYHCLLAHFYASMGSNQTKVHLEKALTLAALERDKKLIRKRLETYIRT